MPTVHLRHPYSQWRISNSHHDIAILMIFSSKVIYFTACTIYKMKGNFVKIVFDTKNVQII